MVWQDVANAVAGIELVCSMLPMVLRGRSKLALSGALTTAGLIVFSVTFATLGLTLSAITTGIQSGLWAYIVFRWGRKSELFSENKNSESKKVDIELPRSHTPFIENSVCDGATATCDCGIESGNCDCHDCGMCCHE